MIKEYYAHSKEGKPPKKWQPLEEHLENVAERAKEFADSFGAGDWGYLAGLWLEGVSLDPAEGHPR